MNKQKIKNAKMMASTAFGVFMIALTASMSACSRENVEESAKKDYVTYEVPAGALMQYGGECNTHTHMPMLEETAMETLKAEFQALGYTLGNEIDLDYNSVTEVGEDRYTYFNKMCVMPAEKSVDSIQINCDTYSNRVHSMTVFFESMDNAQIMLAKVLEYLESYDIDTGKTAEELVEAAFDFSAEDFTSVESGNIKINTTVNETKSMKIYEAEVKLLH